MASTCKFVDDLTILDIVPRNSPPVIKFLGDDVHVYAREQKMILNPTKCKCIVVDFVDYNSSTWSPVFIGNMVVEHVQTSKLFGFTIGDDLKWDSHCDIVVRKANKQLNALRQLKKCGVTNQDIVVYFSVVRSVLEYGCVVFNNMSKYLSQSLERVQKRAINIIYPSLSYEVVLINAGLATLKSGCIN